jgi:DNA-binding CsgD family transcriptional regulator
MARQAVLLLAEGASLTEIARRLSLSLRDARVLLEQAQAQAQAALV